MQDKNRQSWLNEIVARFKQSHLSLNVDNLSQLDLSDSLKGFLIEIIQIAQKESSQPSHPEFLEELQKLGVKEIEQITTNIDIVLSSQQPKSTIQYVQNQFVFAPPVVTAPKKTFQHSFGLPDEFLNFTGREKPLEQIEAHLSLNQANPQPKVIISGTAGIGKTQLAIAAAYRQLKFYHESLGKSGCKSVIWFMAGNDDILDNKGLMTEQFQRLGQQLGLDPKELTLKDLIAMVYQLLQEKHAPYMVVFDNTQNKRQISTYLPPVKVPTVITTKNNNERDFDPSFKNIVLDTFSLTEALTYTQKVLSVNHAELYQEEEAKLLADTLGHFPLSLTQALAYITAENMAIQNYREAFRQQKAMYLQERLPMGDPYQEEKNPPDEAYDSKKATVWAVIQLSLNKVNEAKSSLILKACAYLAPEAGIDIDLLNSWAPNPKACRDFIVTLRQYSLLENMSLVNHIRIHQLVQEILKLDDSQQFRLDFLCDLARNLGKHYDVEETVLIDEARQMRLLPHLQIVLNQIEKAHSKDESLDVMKASLQNYLGNIYCAHLKNPTEAAQYYEQALQYYESSKDQPNIAISLMHRGIVEQNLGNLKRAKALLERALNIQLESSSRENITTASILTNLGVAEAQIGNQLKAKAHFQAALEIQKPLLGSDHAEVATTMMNLGVSRLELGETTEAKELLEESLLIQEALYGHNHQQVALCKANLGYAHRKLGDLSQACRLLKEALTIQERIHGPDHALVAATLRNLGGTLADMKHHSEALAISKRALAIEERVFGSEHVEVATTLVNIAVLTALLGNPLEAEKMMERAWVIIEGTQRPEDPKLAETLNNLATLASKLGNNSKAKTLYERGLKMQEGIFGPEHPELVHVLHNLGITYGELGYFSESKMCLERALKIQKNTYGTDHPLVARTQFDLGATLITLNETTAALEQLNHCYKVSLVSLGDQHPLTQNAKDAIKSLQKKNDSSAFQASTSFFSVEKNPWIKMLSDILDDPSLLTFENFMTIGAGCFSIKLNAEGLRFYDAILAQMPSFDLILLRAKCLLGMHQRSACRATLEACKVWIEEDSQKQSLEVVLAALEQDELHAKQQETELRVLESNAENTLRDELKMVFLLRALNRFDEALSLTNTIISKKPALDILVNAYYHQAECYFTLQLYHEAQESCALCLQLTKAPRLIELNQRIAIGLEVAPKLEKLLILFQEDAKYRVENSQEQSL